MADPKFGKWEFSARDLQNQILHARERGIEESKSEPKAEEVSFDKESNLIYVHFANGSLFGFPPNLIEELTNANIDEIAEVSVTPVGDGIHWNNLDAHYTVIGLLNGIFGTKAWMRALGQKGGKSVSDAKREASRINGAKGGRPKKSGVENHQEVRCDFCGSSSFSKGTRFHSPAFTTSSKTTLAELDSLNNYLMEPLKKANFRGTSVRTVSPEFFNKKVYALALEK